MVRRDDERHGWYRAGFAGAVSDRSRELVLIAGQSRWMTAADLVAEAVRERADAARDAAEDDARAALDARPIRVSGARPIPPALTGTPAQHGPTSQPNGHRRNQ